MIDCGNRADDDGFAALMALDVDCFPDRNGPDPPFQGREAFLRYARGWTEAFEHYAVESCEYLDFGEYVIVIGRTVARGRGSGSAGLRSSRGPSRTSANPTTSRRRHRPRPDAGPYGGTSMT